MTCIVGLESDDGVWFAGDRYFGDGPQHDLMDVPKVVRRGPCLLGFCGGMREGQVLERVGPPRKRHRAEDLEAYLAEAVVAPLMQALARAGVALSDDFAGLIGVAGRVYLLEYDGGFWRSTNGYQAIGAAGVVALGSLASTADVAPAERLALALRAAERHSPYCRPPFDVLRLPG